MPFIDLERRRITVRVAGVDYSCRPPTLVTVCRFVAAYAFEIAAVGKTDRAARPKTAADARGWFLAVPLDTTRCAPVLASCVDPEPTGEAMVACFDAVLSLVDPLRVGDELARNFDELAGWRTGADGPTRLAVSVATALHADPFVVANDWPFEALLSIAEALGDKGDDVVMAHPSSIPLIPGIFGEAVIKRPLPE